ncbi:MAG: heavy-metal-associated domain-containing protein [Rhodocyclaceae bacterium]|nr:heavy-metal-associated domain-containing protein [Rhodocyclaceae bacterium]
MEDVVIKVGGMSCQGCVRNVTGVLQAQPGVAQVEVSLEDGEAHVRFDAGKVALDQLRGAVEEAGFDAL